jgi:hypothetical protein
MEKIAESVLARDALQSFLLHFPSPGLFTPTRHKPSMFTEKEAFLCLHIPCLSFSPLLGVISRQLSLTPYPFLMKCPC